MKYYCVADIHGFYRETIKALSDAGYFTDTDPHKLIILGDILDRGSEADKMVKFVLEEMDKKQVILIRGNHEDLLLNLIDNFDYWLDRGILTTHLYRNGTYQTLADLSGMDIYSCAIHKNECIKRARKHPFITKIIPSMIDFFETKNYLFVHGWVPCDMAGNKYVIENEFKKSPNWDEARWINGMKAHHDGAYLDNKTIVCGHWHVSFGHANYEHDGTEFGENANFNPYFAKGIIAIDACTVLSKKVNCLVIEDEEI